MHFCPAILALFAIGALSPNFPAVAATVLPVGPIPFNSNADYDANFKEPNTSARGISRNAAGYLELLGSPNGIAVYDAAATGGAGGSGGTGGADTNIDLRDFTIAADFASSTTLAGLGFYLRLDSSESNGYFAAILFQTPSQARFDLFEHYGTSFVGPNIFSVTRNFTGFSFAPDTFYNFSVTAQGGSFGFNFDRGRATAAFTDTTVIATVGQVGFNLATSSQTSATRLVNFSITSVPEADAATLLGAGAVLFAAAHRARSRERYNSAYLPRVNR